MTSLPRGRDWTLADAERYLLSLELFGMRFGLDRMRRLLTVLGNPQRSYDTIHVVGTNGKSSTTRMIAALLAGEGLRSGAYMSPHLLSYAERVQVAGADISGDAFAAAIAETAHGAEKVNRTLTEPDDVVTQFELLTAAAFLALAQADVDVAVIEAGLGGRYDATNVLESRVQVLTNVGLEHTRWLGPTVTDIAGEKLDVVRPGGTLALGADLHPDARTQAQRIAGERGARIVTVEHASEAPLRTGGAYQRANFALACLATEAFLGHAPSAVVEVAAELVVPGRFQRLDGTPPVLLDGAHNADGIAALVRSLPEFAQGRPVVCALAVLDDKDAAAMLKQLAPHCSRFVLCAVDSPRALPAATLASLARQVGASEPEIERRPVAALRRAREIAGVDGVVLATGSIYLVSELLRESA